MMNDNDIERINMIKKMARESMDIWAKDRQDLLDAAGIAFDLLSEPDKRATESMRALFKIADQLSDAVRNCIDIESPITPEVVSIVSSMVLGITNAQGAREVEKLMAIRAMAKNSSKATH